MTRQALTAFILAMALSPAAIAADGNGVGNGGDPLRPLFSEARLGAVERAEGIKPCSFDQEAQPEAVAWILAHQGDYADDLSRSKHVWITDPQPTCAWTHDSAASDITLSFEACRPLIRTQADAMHQLFHESVHHFGITDEDFAEAVARAMSGAKATTSCASAPQDPFDPRACQGKPITPQEFLSLLGPGGQALRVGQLTPYSYRKRKCISDSEGSCSAWQYLNTYINTVWAPGATPFVYQPELRIESGMQVTLRGSDSPYSYGGIFDLPIQGVGTPEISAGRHSFPWAGLKDVKLQATGRMTKDCLLLQSKYDLENEAAILIPLR